MSIETGRYEELRLKYRRQRTLYRQKRQMFQELRALYKQMGDFYREYRTSYWLYWRTSQNSDDDPLAAVDAQRKIEQFHSEIDDIRVTVFQKQQQIEAFQKANQGWMVWRPT